MKKNTFKFVFVAMLFAVVFSSCATKKKYGCPEHISIQKVFGL